MNKCEQCMGEVGTTPDCHWCREFYQYKEFAASMPRIDDWMDWAMDPKQLKTLEEFISYRPMGLDGKPLIEKRKRDMVWEWNWPRFFSFSHTINFFWTTCNFSYKGDHSPGFHFELGIFNLVLLDFGFYNRNHEDYDEWTGV